MLPNIEDCPTPQLCNISFIFRQRVDEGYARLRKAREDRDEDNIVQATLELERYKDIYDAIIDELKRRLNDV